MKSVSYLVSSAVPARANKANRPQTLMVISPEEKKKEKEEREDIKRNNVGRSEEKRGRWKMRPATELDCQHNEVSAGGWAPVQTGH